MDKKEINNFFACLLQSNSVVLYEQIPEIDLYMDQLTTFLEDKLKSYKREKNDKILTKTMINNYTKDNILPPPDKKKYSKEQVALLILIYHLKSEISINDISAIFDVMEEKKISIESLYISFTQVQQNGINSLLESISGILGNAGEIASDKPEAGDMYALIVIILLIMEANSKKQLAERLIDKLKNNMENKKADK